LCRRPDEPVDAELAKLYEWLLAVLRQGLVRNGGWQLLDCLPAWEGNWTWDDFVAFAWQGPEEDRLIAAVNYAPNQSQCFVRLPFLDLGGQLWRLRDLLGETIYEREGNDLQGRGLYLDVPPWKASVFFLQKRDRAAT
jgi:hypothetical protein